MGEGVSLMGLFMTCLLMCLFKNRYQASRGVLNSLPFNLLGSVKLKKYLLIELQEASFVVLIWYRSSVPFTAFDERIGCTTNGPSKKEVTVYFWGGFSAFYGFIRANCTLAVLNRASA